MDGMSSHHKHNSGFENSRFSLSSTAMAPGHHRYPEVKSPLRRQVHAPSRVRNFGLSALTRHILRNHRTRQVPGNVLRDMDFNIFKRNALDLPLSYRTYGEVINVEDELRDVEMISDDTNCEFKIVANVAMEVDKAENLMMDNDSQANKKSLTVSKQAVTDVWSFEAYKKGLESAVNRFFILKDRGFGTVVKERCYALVRRLCSFIIPDVEPVEDVRREAFLPLSKEEETAVKCAFSGNNLNVLVTHENSNIDITVKNLRCLKPGQWLNDEVINLYLVLLKEREAREPKKFLKCHFFNTFFFTKLVNSKNEYNYGAVKRWTLMKRLGYHLTDCDKIFVPIHMNIHWTLAVINIKDQKFQYLDSFKGREPRILDALARYFADEVRDKNEEYFDVSQWRQEFVQDLPEQRNGFDCGMFMLKYIDFFSRGLDLCFTEEHMPYFRVRTAKEILQLKAE